MDGTSNNQMFDGRLLRPLSPQEASDSYYIIVLGMIFKDVSMHRQQSVDGIDSYSVISNNPLRSMNIRIPAKDARKLVSISQKLRNLPSFPTTPESDLESLIRAEILATF